MNKAKIFFPAAIISIIAVTTLLLAHPASAFIIAPIDGNCCPNPANECCESLCTGQDCGPTEVSPAPGMCSHDSTAHDFDQSVCVATGTEESGTTEPVTATTIAPRDLPNPLGDTTTIPALIGNAITIFTGIAGSVALLMFVYGGVMWLLSGGSAERIEKGRRAMVWAVIGLAIIFGAYAILRTLFLALGARL